MIIMILIIIIYIYIYITQLSAGLAVERRPSLGDLLGCDRLQASLGRVGYVCIYIYICIHTYTCIYIYIYIYRERERL